MAFDANCKLLRLEPDSRSMRNIRVRKTLKFCLFAIVFLCAFLFLYPPFVWLDWFNIAPYLPANALCSNCNNFTYRTLIENRELCSEGDVFLLMLVTSRPANMPQRHVIREGWGSIRKHRGHKIRLLFVIGKPRLEALQTQIHSESLVHKDILQGDFEDSYLTLTNKIMWGLSWAKRHCHNAKFILKTDDNTLNVPHRYVDHLSSLLQQEAVYIGGFCLWAPKPRRLISKWHTPAEMYSAAFYPVYCTGPAYVLSMAAVRSIVDIAKDVRFLPWEDVFVTGLCRAACGIDFTIIVGIVDYTPYHVPDCALATQILSYHNDKDLGLQERWKVVNDVAKRRDCERRSFIQTVFRPVCMLVARHFPGLCIPA